MIYLILLNIALIYGGYSLQTYMYLFVEDLHSKNMDFESHKKISMIVGIYYGVLLILILLTNIGIYLLKG